QFVSGDKTELDLAIGAQEKGGSRRYAKLAGKDLVFLLDAKLAGQATAEYRPRGVFKDGIDPAQIEAVRFGYRKDPFELKKVDGAWQVGGKPDVKGNDTAGGGALSARGGLEVGRDVKGGRGPLKADGLGPPELGRGG